MSRALGVGLGLILLGAFAVDSAGCGSSNNDTPEPGGACCSCVQTSCGASGTLSPPAGIATIPNCTTYCQANYHPTCAASGQSTITGVATACPAGGGGDGGQPSVDTGTRSDGGSPNMDAMAQNLGVACTSDVACGGLQCTLEVGIEFTANVVTQVGYPNGICTLPCSMTSNPCASVGGTCVLYTQTSGVCQERCTVGPATTAAQKCHGRRDESCQPVNPNVATTATACLPTCITDADCGQRKCDPTSGLCLDQVTPSPIGLPCTSDAECGGGFCLGISATQGFCSAVCTLGAQEACGFTRNPISSASGPVGGCAFTPLTNPDTGDQGWCAQLCDSPADCSLQVPEWTCVTDAFSLAIFNHGICDFATITDAGADARPDARADAGQPPPDGGTAETSAASPDGGGE